jgi:endonuclease YncB( thermonuclease family)
MKVWLFIFPLLLAHSGNPYPTLPVNSYTYNIVSQCPRGDSLHGKAIGIVDGDIFDLMISGAVNSESIRIRLEGIDAPEKGQPHGKAAKQYLGELILGKVVRADGAKKDRNGRRICTVFVADTLNINRAMVPAGYSWHFKKYSDDPALDSLERSARAARVGLWAPTEPPVAPWDWRKGKRGNRN